MTHVSLHTANRSPALRGLVDGWLRRLVFSRLEKIESGSLLVDDGGACREFGCAGEGQPAIHATIHDPRFYRQLVFGGSLGAAEAYIRGYWMCEDLVDLVRMFCRNAQFARGLESGFARLVRPIARLAHALRRNTLSGSRRNIAAHYDLGNEFFSLFLDKTMAYSSAVFPHAGCSLYDASLARFEGICRKLSLSADDHLLDVGAGWGGFALYAAEKYGCRVTTTTISREQYEFTRRRVEEAGLVGRVSVLCEDYRGLSGSYDKLVSIEMIEAVGHQYFDTYFQACSRLLKPDGSMLLQAIVIPERRYQRYLQSADFIQRYVFPGGCLPSIGAVCRSLGRATDLQLAHLEDITPHYAETLACWRKRFSANIDRVRSLGFSDAFIRTWEYYFCYCEGGFRERAIGDVQMLLVRPSARVTLAPNRSS